MKHPRPGRQLTFDGFPKSPSPKEAPKAPKEIAITELKTETGIDELTLKVAFKLCPSRMFFSKVKTDLLFNNELANSVVHRIPQGPLATDEYVYTAVLDMKGIPAGTHSVKVEMHEQGEANQKLCQTSKEGEVDYVPQTRQSGLVRIPTVKTVAGSDLAVSSQTDKAIYVEIEKTAKKEYTSKRDEW